VNQVLGDGIMSIFGAPIAHEDQAARACYAALAMQAAMQPYADEVRRTRGITMRIRVGLNSGEVVVRTIGNDLHMDSSAVGQTTHLAARIDRLPQEEKQLLQTASVIGNEVPFTLLQAIAEIPENTLHRGLTHLQATEFLYETSLFPERVYTFKHALTHEVPYAASGRMAETSALLEQMLVRVLDQTPHQTETILSCSEAYLMAHRVAEASRLAQRALAHTQDHKEQGYQARVLWLLGEIAMHRDPPEAEQAEIYYQQALTLANELGMRPLQAHCHRGLGNLYGQTGQVEQARSELTTAMEMYREMEMNFWLPETEAALAAVEGR
jgi:tetratricopeptide (TPR) repeat protein